MFSWFRWRSTKPTSRTAKIYTRVGCHLCEVAAETLRQAGYATEMIDIDGDPELRQQFDHEIPVVEIDSRVRFRGHVDPLLLRRLQSGEDVSP